MKSHSTVAVVVGVVSFLAAPAAWASVLYWDTTPLTTGSVSPGNGCWDTDNYWAADTSGNGATTWVAGSDANFYADSSPTSTVTIASTVSPVSVGNITFTGSGYTVTGGSLNLSGGTITTNQNATINSAIGGTVGVTKVGPGTLTLDSPNTYSGATNIQGGVFQLVSTQPLIWFDPSNPSAVVTSGGNVTQLTNLGASAPRPTRRARQTGAGLRAVARDCCPR